MQIVIELNEEVYDEILNEIEHAEIAGVGLGDLSIALKNGILLPKGHGDLKDASKMIADLNTVRVDNYAETIEWTCNVIDSYPTIIEADKEVDDADSN